MKCPKCQSQNPEDSKFCSNCAAPLYSSEEALHIIQELEKYGTNVRLTILKAQIYAKYGKREEAENLLKIIIAESEKTHISPAWIASIYGFLGDFDRAFSFLEKAYSDRDPWLSYLNVEPMFDSLHTDPRYKELLNRMNLEKY